jgi:hypothetical protein
MQNNDNQQVQNYPKLPDTWFWVRGSDGNASVSTTFVLIAFWVTTIAYILSIFESIGPVKIRAFDAAAASVYLVPLLTLYFGRRYTEATKNKQKENNNTNNIP